MPVDAASVKTRRSSSAELLLAEPATKSVDLRALLFNGGLSARQGFVTLIRGLFVHQVGILSHQLWVIV